MPSLPRAPSIPLSVLTDRSRTRSSEVVITQRNTPALFGDGADRRRRGSRPSSAHRPRALDARPALGRPQRQHDEHEFVGEIARLPSTAEIGRFGWKLEFATLNDFVKAGLCQRAGPLQSWPTAGVPLGQLAYKSEGDRTWPD